MVIVGANTPSSRSRGARRDWKPLLARVIGGGGVTTQAWQSILSSLPGRPLEVTSDEDSAFFAAVARHWRPDMTRGEATPSYHLCPHHAKKNFAERAAPASLLRQPYTPEAARFWQLFDELADGTAQW